MILIAHRGASAEAPENTLEAFERAVDARADMIELDLRVTSDGVVYVAHDAVREGALGWTRPRWSRIEALGASRGLYPGLGAVLDRLAARIPLNLEIKERAAVGPLVREIERRGLVEGLVLSSFDPHAMREARRLAPRLRRGLLVERLPRRLAAAIAAEGARSLHVPAARVTPRVVEAAHGAGVPVWAWTVDDPAAILRLGQMGVDGVFTNDPRGVRRALEGGGNRWAGDCPAPSGTPHT